MGIVSKIIESGEKAQKCLEVIDSLITNDSILALDECDYGGARQMSIGQFAEHPKYKKLYISATTEEIIVALQERDIYNPDNHLIFEPSHQYRGSKWYLDNGLVYEPTSFFCRPFVMASQGEKIIQDCIQDMILNENRSCIMVRYTGKEAARVTQLQKMKKEKHPEYIALAKRVNIKLVNSARGGETFAWDDKTEWDNLTKEKPTLFIITQTCTRSTQICHERLYAYHDYRFLSREPLEKCLNTLSQAFGRVKHYVEEGHQDNMIRCYIDADVFKVNCGRKNRSEIKLLSSRTTGTRVRKQTTKIKFWLPHNITDYEDAKRQARNITGYSGTKDYTGIQHPIEVPFGHKGHQIPTFTYLNYNHSGIWGGGHDNHEVRKFIPIYDDDKITFLEWNVITTEPIEIDSGSDNEDSDNEYDHKGKKNIAQPHNRRGEGEGEGE